jgi:hypothetical protein
VTRDRYRPLTAAAVLLTATIVAVISYMHVACWLGAMLGSA